MANDKLRGTGFNPAAGKLPDTADLPELPKITRADGADERLLEGKTAIVTGGGKGIGKGISRALASAGANVVIVGNLNMTMAEETVALIRSEGGRAECIGRDLSLPGSPKEIVAFAVEKFGGVDILVNNAAYQPNRDVDDYNYELFRKVMSINLYAYVRMLGECLPYLKRCGEGRVINVSSVHGKRVGGFDLGYSTSKGGISMFTREAAVALQEFGITVNAILPGGTAIEFKSGETNAWKGLNVKRPRTFRRYFRTGLPADSGNYAVYLCSQLGEHITGTQTRLDGGLVLY